MLLLPFTSQLLLPTTRTVAAITADLERLLRDSGAVPTRRGDGALAFTVLPLRHLFPSLTVADGGYQITLVGASAQINFRGSTPILPVLGPIALVMLIMGGMAIQAGAPALNIATISAVALLLVSFVVPALGKLAMTRLARRALSP